MQSKFADSISQITAMYAECRDDEAPDLFRRVLDSARRGVDCPSVLTSGEIEEICYALIVHYAHMGIV